jgi:CRISPR/Cas system Type II protein with McrA/HNH and RuvC-like nuclease domain
MQSNEGYDLSLIDDEIVKSKIEHIETGEDDERIEKSLREYFLTFPETFLYGGIQYSYAAMLIYGIHTAKFTDIGNTKKNYHDIKLLDHGSLRNPIVEQIVNETLQQIKGIWKHFGYKPDEIRIELARDLKNNAEQRKKISEANERAAKVNSYIVKELLRIRVPVTATNILKFKLWEQQKKCCPYTGQTIPLNNGNGLFSGHYDVDHILPQSRYFDDSISNKVVTRKEINTDKGNKTAWEYITTSSLVSVKLSENNFIQHITENYFGRKRTNLLMKKIPDDFIERQKKDTQYISIKVKEQLAEIVGTNNVFTSTGIVTDYLRQHWGLTEMFKEVTKNRFATFGMTLNENWVEMKFDEERNKHILKIKNWSKRYDHRHHAIDALVVACTTPVHIYNLNNLNKKLQTWLQQMKSEVFNELNFNTEEILNAYFNLISEKREKIQVQIEGFH